MQRLSKSSLARESTGTAALALGAYQLATAHVGSVLFSLTSEAKCRHGSLVRVSPCLQLSNGGRPIMCKGCETQCNVSICTPTGQKSEAGRRNAGDCWTENNSCLRKRNKRLGDFEHPVNKSGNRKKALRVIQLGWQNVKEAKIEVIDSASDVESDTNLCWPKLKCNKLKALSSVLF